jgi:transmembrane sensor
MRQHETADEIEAAAARWVWRLDQQGRDPAVERELEAWMAADSRRRGAFLQAEAAWNLMDNAPWAVTAGQPAIGRRAVLAGAGAALAASVSGLAVMLLQGQYYRTVIGEIRRVPLQDGSLAAINTASAVAVSMEPARRLIRLDRGEAWFEVAKDAARPFVVEAGRVRVRAVGTAFSVRRRPDGADVLVTEGVVEAWAVGAESQAIRLDAGRKAYLADGSVIHESVAAPSEINRKLAWRDGNIDLAGETLGDAIAEFNRHNRRKLVIADAALADKRLYGVFHTNDPDAFVRAVQIGLGVKLNFAD